MTEILTAPTDERDSLTPWVRRVLEALGHEEAFVSDESTIFDFLEIGGTPYRAKRRGEDWVEYPGDPEIQARNERRLAELSEKLGVVVSENDFIVDVARNLRACGKA